VFLSITARVFILQTILLWGKSTRMGKIPNPGHFYKLFKTPGLFRWLGRGMQGSAWDGAQLRTEGSAGGRRGQDQEQDSVAQSLGENSLLLRGIT
jgi:hypothetical protein